jgi:shikimate kinase
MGAGKTSIGRALARELGWKFYDSDHMIEECAGVDLLWIYDLEGEDSFHKWEQKVIAELTQKPNIILATGGSTVIVPENREAILRNGLIVYLSISLDDQLIRTGYGKKRPLSQDLEERRKILKRLYSEYVPLYEKLADIVFNTDSKTSHTTIAALVKLIHDKAPHFKFD